MLVIGLTGGIGTGKSQVAQLLGRLGAVVISADQVGHEAYRPNSKIWREVVAAFGKDILQPSGEIDRKKLGAVVFSDPKRLEQLNRIMHPRMAQMVADRIQALREKGAAVVVVEAALLFEAGWNSLVDEVWVTDSPEGVIVSRLQSRNGLSEAEARKRIASQMNREEKIAQADVVVDNSRNLDALERTVQELWQNRVVGRIEQR
ncbi:MAG: dephospho-CoA kinase [SAR202 cluster bacterium]|nr:dephospho-CoA kinase [SAR202 cluster bacterium]